MKFNQVLLVVAVVGIQLAAGQILRSGPCRNLDVVTGFNPEKYLGLWFEQQRYEAIFQFAGDCVTADYGLNDDGSIRVVNSMVRLITQTPSSDTGRAVLSFPDANPLPARLNVTFAEGQPNSNNYNVLATDYDNYAVVWSCSEIILNRHAEFLWVLTRDPFVESDQIQDKIDDVLDAYFERDSIRVTYQGSRCPGRQ